MCLTAAFDLTVLDLTAFDRPRPQVNTSNSVSGWSQWPWTRWDRFWESPPIKGFEW